MDPSARARLNRDLTALAGGDRRAFDGVFSVSWPVMRQLAVRILGDPGEAEDAAQRALLKLFSNASCFDSKREALPWVLTFAINECRTVLARRSRRPMQPLRTEPCETTEPEAELVRADLTEAVRQVLGTLSEADRTALGLGGPRATAQDCGLPSATRRKRKQRALGRLRSAWRRIHGTA